MTEKFANKMNELETRLCDLTTTCTEMVLLTRDETYAEILKLLAEFEPRVSSNEVDVTLADLTKALETARKRVPPR